MKRQPPRLGSIDSYLYIISSLRDHLTIEDIRMHFGVPLTTLSYHLKKLRKLDVIVHISYGVWEVKNHHVQRVYSIKKRSFAGQKELRKIGIGRSEIKGEGHEEKFVVLSNGRKVKQDSIGCHGLMFTFSLPSLTRWTRVQRRAYLDSRDIGFTLLPFGERLDSSLTLNWKVQFFNKSLVLYAPVGRRFYGEDAYVAFSEGLFEALRVVKNVEKLMKVSFAWSGKYKWKTTREHHALLGNALAQQYTRNGWQLFLRDAKGLWALIDESILDGEFETVRSGVDGRDANSKVQDFFNGVKDTGITPIFLLEAIAGLKDNAEVFGEHMKTHVSVMIQIKEFLEEFKKK